MFELSPIFNAMMRAKTGPMLLLIQIAITTAIVSNAAFIIHDFMQYRAKETGYNTDSIITFQVMTFGSDRDLQQQTKLDESLLSNIPGVINAAATTTLPLSGGGYSSSFRLKPQPEVSENESAAYYHGNENLLDAFGVKLLEGRNFYANEVVPNSYNASVDSVIVSKAFTDSLFPDEPGLGKTIYRGTHPMKIIGIVDKMTAPWPTSSIAERTMIMPLGLGEQSQYFVVRTEPGEYYSVLNQIESVMLNAYDKRVIEDIKGLTQVKADYDASDTLMMRMLIVLIVMLTLVTVLGIYGLTLFNINKRTRQIGTRRALGARKRDIVRYFLVENVLVTSMGLIAGCSGAIWLGTQLMELYSVPALEPQYVAFTALFVILLSVLAVIFPARRAASISPSIATRTV